MLSETEQSKIDVLVESVQKGNHESMKPLWLAVEGFIERYAKRMILTYGGRYAVELDDLKQSGYLALVDAVGKYEPGKGSAFTSYLYYFLQHEFAKAAGYDRVKSQNDPVNCATSLNATVVSEDDSCELMELQEDKSCLQALTEVEDRIFAEEAHEALEEALAQIQPECSEALRFLYFDGMSRSEAGERMKVPADKITLLESKGIRKLRQPAISKNLREFLESFNYMSGCGLGSFLNTGITIQERYLMAIDRIEGK